MLKNKIPFLTEAIFVNGGRADIVNLYTKEIYEIMVSESAESIEAKKKRYPSVFTIKEVRI